MEKIFNRPVLEIVEHCIDNKYVSMTEILEYAKENRVEWTNVLRDPKNYAAVFTTVNQIRIDIESEIICWAKDNGVELIDDVIEHAENGRNDWKRVLNRYNCYSVIDFILDCAEAQKEDQRNCMLALG
jgi:hypothetical protein